MKKTKKILACALILSTIVMSGCSQAKNNSKTEASTNSEVSTNSGQESTDKKEYDLKIGYLAIPGNSLFMIAEENGYFEEQGINAEMTLFKSSSEGMAAMQSGKIDTGCMGTTALMSLISQGQDISIYGGQMSEGSGIVTTPENAEELSDFSNYKGKKLGVVRMSTGDVLFRSALIKEGFTINEDVTIVELDSAASVIEAVKKGEIDAGGLWIPHLKNAESQGLKIAVLSGDVMPVHPCARMVAMSDSIKNNEDLYVKIQKACIKAYDFFLNNQEETIDILLKYIELDRDVLTEETYNRFTPTPDPNRAGNVEFWKMMNEIGYIESDLDMNDFVNTDIFKKALDEMLAEYPDNACYKTLEAEFQP